jgi:hypothetical protein
MVVIMREMTEVAMINQVLSWLSNHIEKETFRLQHAYAVNFVAMGHGWCEFDLHLWDGSCQYMEAWVDREETEITITNRNPVTDETELTFLDKIYL